MATPSGGKFRPKRSHYSRKPYERPKPKSLLARVSDSVKDFITPSWLNNLWNNPNDDDGEGSSRSSTPELPQPDGHVAGTPNFMPSAVATSTPDINLRTGKEALSMPGPSRMETTPIVQLREDVVRDGGGRNVGNEDDDVVIIEEEQPSTSTGVRHTPLPFRNYANPIGTSTPNEDMQLLGGRKQVIDKDDASDTSVSTSGCSSLVPHVDRIDHREKLSKKNLDRLSEMGHSNSLAKSSLWTDLSSAGPSSAGAAGLSASRPQPSVSSAKRPAFNSSYFGSPKVVGEPRPKHASPFYPGRTQFGGSSAQRSALKRPRDSPYEVHLPVKRNIRPKPAQLNLQDGLGATSSTAKKILDTLERMSTPLLDVKRIPLSPTASPYSFRPTSRLTGSRPGTSRMNTPPTSGLRIAHQASIKQNRQPPVSTVTTVIDLDREERVTAPSSAEVLPTSTAAPTIVTAPSFRYGAPITSSTPAEGPVGREKTGGKMKSKSRHTMHYSAQKADEECEIPDLPELALPLPKGLPTFSFGSLTSSSSISKPSSSSTAASTMGIGLLSSSSSTSSTSRSSSIKPSPAQSSSTVPSFKFASPASSPEGPQFTFASPIMKQTGTGGSTSSSINSSSTVTTFKFSMPRQTPYSTSRPSSSAPLGGGKKPSFETPERTRRKGDDDEDVVQVEDDDEEEEEEGGIKVAKELKTGSCLEAFGIRPTKNGPIPSSSSKVQEHLVKASKTNMDNGPLTGGLSHKPGASNLQNDTSKTSNSIFNKFKPPASSQNNEDVSKCVACTTPKPGQSATKPATSTAPVGAQSNSLFNKLKPAANSWECDACWVQNSGDASKCVACTAPKPGQSASKPAASSISDSKPPPVFNSLADKFKKKSDEWECDMCMIRNKDSLDKCASCTTPRPGKSKATKTLPNDHGVNNVIAEKFKARAGEWECDMCMIRNKATILKCVACETPKPGSQPTLSAPPASSFKFGSTPMSNGDATGAFKFGNSTTSDSLNSNSNASGGGFKLPAGMSLGQSLKPASTDSNSITTPSAGVGFKLPPNFSLSKLSKSSSNSSTTETSAPSEAKGVESSVLSQAKTEQKLEVKVPKGMSFGASSSESNTTSSGFKAPSGGFKFGQNDASSKSNSSGSIGGGFKFGQSPATVGQTQLDKEGPPPNVNIFQSNVTKGDGPSAKKAFSFGAAAPTSGGTSEKKTDGAAAGPGLSFGSSSSTKETTLNAEPPAFQFGAGAAAFGGAKTTDSTDKPPESKPAFSFGSTATSIANSSAPTSSSTTPSFNFGSSSASKPDSAKALNTDSKPGFSFGSSAPSQVAGSGLSFGAKPQEPAATSANAFTFGQTPVAPEKAATAAAPASFNFGAAPAPAKTKEEPAKGFTFGSQNPNSNQGGSGFSFGTPAASSAAPAQTTTAPSFNFGNANKAPAAPSTGGYNFGATPNSNAQFTGSSTTSGFGGFGSNRSSTNPSPAFGAPPAASQPPSSFSFGSTAPTTGANTNPFGGSSTPSVNATPFGGQPTNPTFGSATTQPQGFGAATPTQGSVFGGSSTNATSNSTFGSGMGGTTTGAPAFGASTTNATPGFGNKPAPAFGSAPANATPGGFGFGKTAPSFSFGATNNATPAAPAPGGFQFTGNQPNQAHQVAPAATPQQAGGFNFAGAGQPSFNFGASAAPQAGATAFQFQGSAGAIDSNPFSASATPGAPQSGRKIKKAVRRHVKR
ncbi:nuclear pore complex protein Nup153 [Strongylocentrotus purpuratus]|uniref:Nuclear pore complex protein Nup153 n=1 Tax=Strongylocentrotus purpuratus TaxID=7668 RepID=A0A7M7NMD3_STRPU|nr:nuclear pore complex protein Nup153 [Strongylocentrotus purpuratus]